VDGYGRSLQHELGERLGLVKHAVLRGVAHRNLFTVIAEQIPAAVAVLNRFHIMRNMNVAIDEVRRQEVA